MLAAGRDPRGRLTAIPSCGYWVRPGGRTLRRLGERRATLGVGRARTGLADSWLPDRGAGRPRRHGGGLPRVRPEAEPAGGAEDPGTRTRRRRGVPAAVHPGDA